MDFYCLLFSWFKKTIPTVMQKGLDICKWLFGFMSQHGDCMIIIQYKQQKKVCFGGLEGPIMVLF